MTHRVPRVGLVGAFGGDNLGNDASALAVIRALGEAGEFRPVIVSDQLAETTRFGPGVESIRIASSHQEATRWRYFLVARDLLRISMVPAAVDAIVVAGGGMFEAEGTRGDGGLFGPLAFLMLALGTRIRRKPFALHAIGGTVVPRRTGRWIVSWIGRLSTRRSFRDDESRDAMVRMGGAQPTDPVVPDAAFVLTPDDGEGVAESAVVREGERRVVIGVMGFAWLHDVDLAQSYENALVDFVVHALDDARVRVELVYGDVADRTIATHLWETCSKAAGGRVTMPAIEDFADLVTHMSGCEVAVCSRFHNVVAAMIAGTPVVAVTDRAKVRSLMAAAELNSYVFEARTVTKQALVRAVDRLEADREGVRAALRARSQTASLAARRDGLELARHLRIGARLQNGAAG